MDSLQPLFTGNDLHLIESLEFNPDLEPSYDLIKSCLVWADERPNGLTPAAYETLCDLWVARSFLHQGLPFSNHSLDPEYFENIWKRALKQGFRWPGFSRLTLNEGDKIYYTKMMQQNEQF